ncbi:hypothetical protein J4G37_50515, partial [Microvirga sp. 3-52]|nr:hypothetical protein [Microvirga sp. 3-52]
ILGIDIKSHKKGRVQTLVAEIEEKLKSNFTKIKIHRLPVTQNTIAFLVNFELNQLQTIKDFMKTISMSLRYVDTTMGWVLTEPFTNFFDLKNVYQKDLQRLIQYRFFLPDTSVMIYDELPSDREVNEPFQLTKFTELFQR